MAVALQYCPSDPLMTTLLYLLSIIVAVAFLWAVVSVLRAASTRSEAWLESEADDGIRGASWRQQASSVPPRFDLAGASMGSAPIGGAEVYFDKVGERFYLAGACRVYEVEVVGQDLLRVVGLVGAAPRTSAEGRL